MSWFSKLLPKSASVTITNADVRTALSSMLPKSKAKDIDTVCYLLQMLAPDGIQLTIMLRKE